MPILMMIGPVARPRAALPLVIVHFMVPVPYLSDLRNNIQFLVLLQKQNTGLWPKHLVSYNG